LHILDFIRAHSLALPNLAKFAIALAIIVGVPPYPGDCEFLLLSACCLLVWSWGRTVCNFMTNTIRSPLSFRIGEVAADVLSWARD
jgi:hypothetical protein